MVAVPMGVSNKRDVDRPKLFLQLLRAWPCVSDECSGGKSIVTHRRRRYAQPKALVSKPAGVEILTKTNTLQFAMQQLQQFVEWWQLRVSVL